MADNFGVPPSEFETVDSFASPAPGYGAAPSGGGKKNRTMMIVVVVVLVLLCCCCIVGVGTYLWYYGDSLAEQFGSLAVLPWVI